MRFFYKIKKDFVEGVGSGFLKGIGSTFEGLYNMVVHPLDTLGGLATLAGTAVVGYSSPGIGGSPQERLQAFDGFFGTNLADVDAGVKQSLSETWDTLQHGSDFEQGEIVGQAIEFIAEIAVGSKGAGAALKSVKAGSMGSKMAKIAGIIYKAGDILKAAGGKIKQWTLNKLPKAIKGIFGKGKILLKSETKVGTYKELIDAGKVGDNITPHHIPSNEYMQRYMKERGINYSTNDGICINMEQPSPGMGGRHRQTKTYNNNMTNAEKEAYYKLTPQEALEKDINDIRQIYKDEGLYNKDVENSLQEAIKQNKSKYPDLYK